MHQAFNSLDQGELDAALNKVQEALALQPGSAPAHSALGAIYERRGMIPEAIQQMEMAVQLNPECTADREKLERLLRQVAQGLLPEPVRLRVDKRGFFSPQVQWLLDAQELVRDVLARPPTELAELADKKLLRQQVEAFYTQKNPQLAPVVWTALSVGLWLSRTLPRLGGVTTP